MHWLSSPECAPDSTSPLVLTVQGDDTRVFHMCGYRISYMQLIRNNKHSRMDSAGIKTCTVEPLVNKKSKASQPALNFSYKMTWSTFRILKIRMTKYYLDLTIFQEGVHWRTKLKVPKMMQKCDTWIRYRSKTYSKTWISKNSQNVLKSWQMTKWQMDNLFILLRCCSVLTALT